MQNSFRKICLMGTSFDALTMDDLSKYINDCINLNNNAVISNHNMHSVALYHKNPDLKEFYAYSSVVHADGMALILWAKLLGYSVERDHRVTYVDWIRPLIAECAEKSWKVFFLGSAPVVAERAASILCAEFPRLQLSFKDGFFDVDGPENDLVVEAVNNFNPHILIVGMGMPRQERWIMANRSRLRVNIILPAGACMDYVAGAVPTPPRWMGRVGLEWLYRLVSEPKRLAARYLLEPWILLPWVLKDLRQRLKNL